MKHPKVRVTKKHIEAGIRGCITECPVALALKDASGLVWGVIGTYAITEDLALYTEIEIPREVFKRIDQFDTQGQMKPFSFVPIDRVEGWFNQV
jgi:hypothetical protein